LAWRLGWRHWRAGGSPGAEPVPPRALLSFGVHTSLSTTMFSGRDLLIPIILGSLAGPAAVGLFRVALLPVTGVALLGAPVRLLLLPEQAKLAASRRFDALWRSIRAHTAAGLAIGLPGAVVGWFVLDTLIPLVFTGEFGGAVDASRILLIAAVAHLATGWWKTLPAAVGRPELRTLVAGTSLTLTVALLALLGGQGSEGAALAFSLTSLLTAAAWIVMARVLLARAQALAGAQPPDGPSDRARAVARS
jgi:O-antigen/teichoic acid export membrane protein